MCVCVDAQEHKQEVERLEKEVEIQRWAVSTANDHADQLTSQLTDHEEAATNLQHQLVGARADNAQMKEEVESVKRMLAESRELLQESRTTVTRGQEARAQHLNQMALCKQDFELACRKEARVSEALVNLRQQLIEEKQEKAALQREVSGCGEQLSVSHEELRHCHILHAASSLAVEEGRQEREEAEVSRVEVERELSASCLALAASHAAAAKADERQRVMEEELKSHQAQLHERRKQLSTAANHISCLQTAETEARGAVELSQSALHQEETRRQEAHAALVEVQRDLDHLHHDHDACMQLLEQHKAALAEVTMERDNVNKEHAMCYKRSVCGVGVEVCSAPDGSVRVASVTPGGEVCVWRERVRKRETER